MTPDLLTAQESATLVNRPVGTVRGWHFSGSLACAGWRGRAMVFRRAEVLALAAKMSQTRRYARKSEPTLAELDAQIAERSRPENLPEWWMAAAPREKGDE